MMNNKKEVEYHFYNHKLDNKSMLYAMKIIQDDSESYLKKGHSIELGAGDRETALRWIHEAEGTDGDNDYLCFKLNIPYDYIK